MCTMGNGIEKYKPIEIGQIHDNMLISLYTMMINRYIDERVILGLM